MPISLSVSGGWRSCDGRPIFRATDGSSGSPYGGPAISRLAARMNGASVNESFSDPLERAWMWAAARGFAGVDPYDALASPLLGRLHEMFGRAFGVGVTQILRRLPLDARRLLRIRSAANPKALGLFLASAVRRRREGDVRALASRLHELRAPGYDCPCWGYPFPWRARAFYLPIGTPTVVATAFVADAFLDAYEWLGDPSYLACGLEACRFLDLLHRTSDATGVCLSYSPADRSAVYNASLLGARLLVRAGLASGRADLIDASVPLVRYVLARQRRDGTWSYGGASHHAWVDSFHTGFVIDALGTFVGATGDPKAAEAHTAGAHAYRSRFFGPNGEPYYFADTPFPYDVHAAAQGVITLARLGDQDSASRARVVGRFLVERFLSDDGSFRYQIRRTHRVSIPYMRWSQAWGVRALAELASSGRLD